MRRTVPINSRDTAPVDIYDPGTLVCYTPLADHGRMSEPSEIDKMSEQWERDQLKPLSMVDLAKQWTDAIKVVGSGNGAALLAAGAALNAFAQKPIIVTCLKWSAASFFIGVFTFVAAFYCIQASVFAHDEVAHATFRKDLAEIRRQSNRSAKFMMATNHLVNVSTIAFVVGCVIAFAALVIV